MIGAQPWGLFWHGKTGRAARHVYAKLSRSHFIIEAHTGRSRIALFYISF